MNVPRQSFSSFCEDLNCKLVNVRQSWSAYNEKINRGVFNIWDDRLDKKLRYEFGEAQSNDTRFGAKSLRNHIRAVIENGDEAFGILSTAKDVDAAPRSRKTFDSAKLLVLRLTEEKGTYVAYVTGRVALTSIKAGQSNRAEKFPDSIDDLDDEPPGNESPNRVPTTYSGFPRDPKIRDAVRERAGGRCEYCGQLGFALSAITNYVEAHHIIHLAAKGPDTLDNVIALCSNHHREAHYGVKAAELESQFIAKLKSVRSIRKRNK